MKYGELITKSLKIVWKNKFLWVLGMLAALTEGGISSGFHPFGYSTNSNNFEYHNNSTPSQYLPTIQQKTQVLGAEANKFTQFVFNHPVVIALIVLILFLLFLMALVFSVAGRGGLVASILKIEQGKKTSFKYGFKDGFHYFWRVLGQGLLIGLILAVLIFICGSPVVALVLLGIPWGALGLGLLFVPILILLGLYLSVIRLYGIRAIVIENMGIVKGIQKAHQLIMKHKLETFLIWLISIGLSLAAGFAIFLAIFLTLCILGVPVLGIGLLIYKTLATTATLVFAGLVLLLFLLLFWVVAGAINAFVSSFWTLGYLELKNNKRKS